MKTITIPKELGKRDDLVVVPRKEYEKLVKVNEFHEAWDKSLQEGLIDSEQGRKYGTFKTAKETMQAFRNKSWWRLSFRNALKSTMKLLIFGRHG